MSLSERLDQLSAERSTRPPTAADLEVRRITSLPVMGRISKEEIEETSRQVLQAAAYEEGYRLKSEQADAITTFRIYGGLFGTIPVGEGKTLTSLYCVAEAYRRGVPTSILLVPPEVYPQLRDVDVPNYRTKIDLAVPLFFLGGSTPKQRRVQFTSGRRGCYVLPYSYLSTRDTEEMLACIAPKLLVLDEAHAVKKADAARRRRLFRYIRDHSPQVVALSGTMAKRSLMNFHHIIVACLSGRAPVPMTYSMARDWAAVLDAEAEADATCAGPLEQLVEWTRREFPYDQIPPHTAGFRYCFRRRLESAPGVVTSSSRALGVGLVIQSREVPDAEKRPGWAELRRLVADVEERWISPSGDEIEWAFHQHAYLSQLTAGMFYRLVWPTVEQVARAGRLSDTDAAYHLECARWHHKLRQEYHRELRQWLKNRARQGLDTPGLVGASMHNHGARDVEEELHKLWAEMKRWEFPGMPERQQDPVRVCDYKVHAAVKWAKEIPHPGGLVWYHHREVGRWLAEAFEAADLPFLHAPAESDRPGTNALIVDRSTRNKFVIASATAHNTGKNLQFHQEQIMVEWERDAEAMQQLLGRTHRTGQEADTLRPRALISTPFDRMALSACLNDALFAHQAMGSPQKLIVADWDPTPKIYPADFLRERGFQPRTLSAKEVRAMEEKFGRWDRPDVPAVT